MDSKNQENYLKKYDEKSLDKLQFKVVFNDPAYLYIFKKTEKVTAALYLITNLISDNEPIKLQIRQTSLKLLSDMLSFKRLVSTSSKSIANDLLARISETMSLLKVASISGLVSSMNYTLVQKELSLLLANLDALNLENFGSSGLSLPPDFFNVPEPIADALSKGHYRTPVSLKDNLPNQPTNTVPSAQKDSLKDNRRETIIKLLKAGKPLGIKELSSGIKGCSEKTIQRELLDLVEKGVLKKTGERRWSMYSIV